MDRTPRAFYRFLTTVVAAAASTCISSGCSTLDIGQDVVDTSWVLGHQTAERLTFLGTSTRIFYPNGVPASISDLPQLSKQQQDKIQDDLQRQADILLQYLARHSDDFSRYFGEQINSVTHQVVHVTDFDVPDAGLQKDGTIRVDIRVIQAVYRGILLSTVGATDSSELTQRRALANVIAARNSYLHSIPSPTVGMSVAALKHLRSPIEMGFAALDQQLTQANDREESERASDSYNDALAFILGHEIGHRALGHYQKLKAGARRRDLELDADRFGALLVVLARNARVSRNNGYFFPPPSGPVEYYRVNDGLYCPLEYNHKPNGSESFFNFGYSLAGFDSLGPASEDAYPPVSERLLVTTGITTAVYNAIVWAQDDLGNCVTSREDRATYRKDPLSRFRARIANVHDDMADKLRQIALDQKSLVQNTDFLGFPPSEEDRHDTNKEIKELTGDVSDLRAIIENEHLAQSVYLDFFNRMAGFDAGRQPDAHERDAPSRSLTLLSGSQAVWRPAGLVI